MSEPTSDVTNTACELMSEERLASFGRLPDVTASNVDELLAALRAERTKRIEAEDRSTTLAVKGQLLLDVAKTISALDRCPVCDRHMYKESEDCLLHAAIDRAKKGGAFSL